MKILATKLAYCTVIIALISIVFFLDPITSWLFPLVEKYLSPDQNLSSGEDGVKLVMFSIIALLILLNVLVLFRVDRYIPIPIKSFLSNDSVNTYFFQPDFANSPKILIPKNTLIIAIILSLVSAFLWIFRENPIFAELYEEDHFFEYFSVLLFLVSAFLFVRSGLKYSRIQQHYNLVPGLKYVFFLFAAGLVLVAMEEISWGQRIFGFEPHESLNKLNYQGEVNLHNIFNPFYELAYPIIGVSFFLVLFIGWIPSRSAQPLLFKIIFPHPCLFPFAVVLKTSSIPGESELFEVLLSYFVFFYILRVYFFLSELKTSQLILQRA